MIVTNLTEQSITGDEEIFEKFWNVVDEFHESLFPATKIYEAVAGKDWGRSRTRASKWRKQVICIIAMCKLIEDVIKIKLPLLQEKAKGIIHKIYSKLFNNLEYPKRIREYLAKETDFSNIKIVSKYRRMGEILAFE